MSGENTPTLIRMQSVFYGLVLLITLALGGCTPTRPQTTPQPGVFEVDPVFREFYRMLGGEPLLGPAITRAFRFETNVCQYTQNALMCFNPYAEDRKRFYLFPLGQVLNLREDPGLVSGEGPIVNGYLIYEEFVPLYDRLGGSLYAGHPLTQPRYNATYNRIEQYFENIGFYRNLDEPPGSVHLLAYGVFACDAYCRYQAPLNGIVTPLRNEVPQPFLSRLARLGGLAAFGRPLSEPYQAPDGAIEQIYETVVLYAPVDNPNAMRLRPLSRMLGFPDYPPGPQIYGETDGMIFYPVRENLGFHVPKVFDEFIALHGGREISGNPLEEIAAVGNNRYRQCFENYCLLYDHTAAPSLRVRLLPLGLEYLRRLQPESGSLPLLYSPQSIRLFVSAAATRLPADQPQSFEIVVLDARNSHPLTGIESRLWLTLADGTRLEYRLPPTDAQGRARLSIAPITPEQPNGSVIAYQVCLSIPSDQPICTSDSYLIWNYQ
ncbi:MAG: hypothetical protein N3A60_04005 [Thermanaerothrix sp.]|nr:hypothetical protein [Thermanaerothrix sp.]